MRKEKILLDVIYCCKDCGAKIYTQTSIVKKMDVEPYRKGLTYWICSKCGGVAIPCSLLGQPIQVGSYSPELALIAIWKTELEVDAGEK